MPDFASILSAVFVDVEPDQIAKRSRLEEAKIDSQVAIRIIRIGRNIRLAMRRRRNGAAGGDVGDPLTIVVVVGVAVGGERAHDIGAGAVAGGALTFTTYWPGTRLLNRYNPSATVVWLATAAAFTSSAGVTPSAPNSATLAPASGWSVALSNTPLLATSSNTKLPNRRGRSCGIAIEFKHTVLCHENP
jgi:hypothetical protein